MLKDSDRIFQNIYGFKGSGLSTANSIGDWKNTKKLIAKGREWIVDEIKKSGLRGRGGAGFSTGMKWSFMPKETGGRPVYLTINADEGEPGTFKDRFWLESNPHKMLEGAQIAALLVGCSKIYLYMRDEYPEIRIRMIKELEKIKKPRA